MALEEPVATLERSTTAGWRTAPVTSPEAAACTYATIVQAGGAWWAPAASSYPPADLTSTDCLHWSLVYDYPPSRPRHASAAVDGQIFLTGGIGQGPRPLPVSETWGRNPTVPGNWGRVDVSTPWRGRREHMMAGFDGKVWVIGGANEAYQWFDDAWFAPADFSSGWAQDAGFPAVGRGDAAVAIFRDELWLIGGKTNDPYVGLLGDAAVRSAGGGWRTAALPFPARSDAQAQVVGDKLYVFGGSGQYGGLTDMYCFDGETWTTLADACPWGGDLFGYFSTVKDGEIYVLGGNNGSGPSGGNAAIWIYTPA